MKNSIIAASLVLITLPLSAQSEESKTGAYINLGINSFDFDQSAIESEADTYFGFGYQLNNHWGVEVEYTELDTSLIGNIPFSVDLWSLNGIYRHNARGKNSLFWKMGLGEYRSLWSVVDGNAARLGVGYDFAINDNFSWVFGIDSIHAESSGGPDLSAYTGISYFFGQASKKPKPAPVPVVAAPQDSDNDGVINVNDQCPTTPANTPVDSRGCELDSDNDGVVDSKDKCLSTPAGAKVDENGCRIVLKEDVSIRLNVQFANNSNEVTDAYRDEIAKVADFMRQYPDTKVVIEGHTDSRGAASYNQSLSQKRATAVMEYLISSFSVATDRVSAVGKGESSPIADNNTAEGRAANRRVQAEIKTSVESFQE